MPADGSTFSSIIDPRSDQDWYVFNAVAGQRYNITTDLLNGYHPEFNISIFAPDCGPLLLENMVQNPGTFAFIPPHDGAYYLVTSAHQPDSPYVPTPGYLDLVITAAGMVEDDHANYQALGTPIAADGQFHACSIAYDQDVDWFTLTLDEPGPYVVELVQYEGNDALGHLTVALINAEQTFYDTRQYADPDDPWPQRLYFDVDAEKTGPHYLYLNSYWGGHNFYVRVLPGAGDATDFDADGIVNDSDNCPLFANADQLDSNGDGQGNVCTFPLGDLNCDGSINAFDIDPFIYALISPAVYADQYTVCNPLLADCNLDRSINAFDIDPFIALLLSDE